MQALGGLGEREREVISGLAPRERPAITVDDVVASTASRASANLMLSRLARKGWLRRLRRGVYAIVPLSARTATPVVDDPFGVAMQVFQPCYLSGWTAAERWALREQVSNTVVV